MRICSPYFVLLNAVCFIALVYLFLHCTLINLYCEIMTCMDAWLGWHRRNRRHGWRGWHGVGVVLSGVFYSTCSLN